MNPRPYDAFDEDTTERLVIRRFRAEDAATLAAYRSDPAVARYQSWDIRLSHAQGQGFIETLETADPDTPGEWFQFALVEASTGVHIGDVAAGVDADGSGSLPLPVRTSSEGNLPTPTGDEWPIGIECRPARAPGGESWALGATRPGGRGG